METVSVAGISEENGLKALIKRDSIPAQGLVMALIFSRPFLTFRKP